MQLPFFFEATLPTVDNFFLSEESSRHIVQVLRMHEKDELLITNGNGEVLTVSITSANKKKTEVTVISKSFTPAKNSRITIAISLIKNTNRLEWFLEKATEIGVSEVILFISDRTEKHYFREDRLKNILVSAMLQSQQCWLPVLKSPVKFKELFQNSSYQNKYIAHCINDEERKYLSKESNRSGDSIILIGPEGDFTKEEIDAAIKNNFIAVSFGETRLRTETAGIAAAVLLVK